MTALILYIPPKKAIIPYAYDYKIILNIFLNNSFLLDRQKYKNVIESYKNDIYYKLLKVYLSNVIQHRNIFTKMIIQSNTYNIYWIEREEPTEYFLFFNVSKSTLLLNNMLNYFKVEKIAQILFNKLIFLTESLRGYFIGDIMIYFDDESSVVPLFYKKQTELFSAHELPIFLEYKTKRNAYGRLSPTGKFNHGFLSLQIEKRLEAYFENLLKDYPEAFNLVKKLTIKIDI